jgi:probable RNA-binding protein EIF1AD
MSGSKRKSSYRKNITQRYELDELELEENSVVAKIVTNRGSGLFEITLPGNESLCIAMLPNKFRNLIWIKRNDYVIVECNLNLSQVSSISVRNPFEIKHILNKNHIKNLMKKKLWPAEFLEVEEPIDIVDIPDTEINNQMEENYEDCDNLR